MYLQGSDIYISLKSPYEELEAEAHVSHRERRKRWVGRGGRRGDRQASKGSALVPGLCPSLGIAWH
jgi:hypothetical protein